MRIVATLVLLLIATGWVLGQLPPAASPEGEVSAWRRTANGWESVETWSRPTGERYPLHPLLVGALQVAISLVALTAASDANQQRAPAHAELKSAVIPAARPEFS